MLKNNLSSSSKTLRNNQKITQEQLQKKLNTLYHQNEKWKEHKQKIKYQRDLAKSLEDMRQCTFKPTINPEMMFSGSNSSSFLKRQNDWLNKKEKKIQDLMRQNEKKFKNQCSFRPIISQKTYTLLHTPKKNNVHYNKTMNSRKNGYSHKNNQKDNQCLMISKTLNQMNNKYSYKEIHLKKQNFKEVIRHHSIYEFNLMTEKRNLMKIEDQEEDNFNNDFFGEDSNMVSFDISPIKEVKSKINQKNYFQNKVEVDQMISSMEEINLKMQRQTEMRILEQNNENEGLKNTENDVNQLQEPSNEQNDVENENENEHEHENQDINITETQQEHKEDANNDQEDNEECF